MAHYVPTTYTFSQTRRTIIRLPLSASSMNFWNEKKSTPGVAKSLTLPTMVKVCFGAACFLHLMRC